MLLAHLSDTHISSGSLERTVNYSAVKAVERVRALHPPPDCTIVTGDLVETGTPDEYATSRCLLDQLAGPVHVVPGNHDNPTVMLSELSGTSYVQRAPAEPDRCYYRVDLPELRLLCCDSNVAGRHHGRLGNTQLRWLDDELGRGDETPTVIALHHHPVRSDIAAMDEIMLADAAEFAGVLARHQPVVRILHGHLHRPMTGLLARAVVMSAPSTDRQVHLDLDPDGPGAFIQEPPGIMLHRLNGNDDVSHLIPVRNPGPLVNSF